MVKHENYATRDQLYSLFFFFNYSNLIQFVNARTQPPPTAAAKAAMKMKKFWTNFKQSIKKWNARKKILKGMKRKERKRNNLLNGICGIR